MTISTSIAQRRHKGLFLAISVCLLATAFAAWKFIEHRTSFLAQIGQIQKQTLLVSKLQTQLAILDATPTDRYALLNLNNHANELSALQTTINKSLNESLGKIQSHHPDLAAIYTDPPYSLNDNFTTIEQLLKTKPVLGNDNLKNLQQAIDQNILDGLEQAATTLDKIRSHHDRWILPGALFLLATLLSLLFVYHRWVFLTLQMQHNRSTAETRQAKEDLDALALTDALTGTANRKAITTFLSDFQNSHSRDGEFVALATLNIDHFQHINDVFGYFAGDAVLQEVASRINNELRSEDQLGRMNADHFAIVLCGLIAPKTAENIIHRIQEAITRPINFKGSDINVTCSIGAAVQEVSSLNLAELFKLSEQALLQAKENRRGSIFLFSENAQMALSRQREIVNVINESKFDDIFELAYQPIVSLENGKIVGCECLLRWIADTPANLETTELVPTLELYGDIHAVGNWVLRQSFAQLKKWQSLLSASSLFMSINVSATQLEASEFADNIIALAEEFQLTPGDISIELTETVAIKHLEAGRKQLALLRNLGFGLSLDDFGTGYSSLQYLKNMPASTIKIDQAFVREMTSDPRDAAIVDSAINIAKAVGLTVIAEGIDSALQAQRLRDIGCHYGQGYYFFRPQNSLAFEQTILAQ